MWMEVLFNRYVVGTSILILLILFQQLNWKFNVRHSEYQKFLDTKRQKKYGVLLGVYNKDFEFFDKLQFLSKKGLLFQFILTSLMVICLVILIFSP